MHWLIKEAKTLLHPHYFMNIALAGAFFVMKTTPPVCDVLFEDCELELREYELLTFLGCIIVLKNRKQPSYKVYIATVCMFGKILNSFCFFRQNPLYGVIYILLCFVHIAFLPEPAYSGPDYVTYFRANSLEEEIKRDLRVTWLVELYAAWSPTCVQFSSTFAELSAKYHLDNFKFGKIDATRYPDIAAKYNVSVSSWSRQLPTLILFQGGKEVNRRPICNAKGTVLSKFIFNEENVIKEFDLNEIYLQCKKNPLTKKKEKKSKGDLEVTANGDSGDKPKME